MKSLNGDVNLLWLKNVFSWLLKSLTWTTQLKTYRLGQFGFFSQLKPKDFSPGVHPSSSRNRPLKPSERVVFASDARFHNDQEKSKKKPSANENKIRLISEKIQTLIIIAQQKA